jgi:hypothetical protein
LYQSAVKAFPNAEVYVAATNDTKTRPFPFSIKEKLAKLAGVAPGHFIQVKSPFKSEEITSHYNSNEDVLIFVRSEKDRTEQPKPGGTKKDGTPAYFQPWTGENLQPFSKHAYIAYLPTVEFGPGIKSATEIRNAWPKLDDRRKTAMVMSLYPVTQTNPKLAANVVKMLDIGMGEPQGVAENDLDRFKKYTRPVVKTTPKIEKTTNPAGRTTDHIEWKVTTPTGEIHRYKSKKQAQEHYDSFGQQGVAEYGPAATAALQQGQHPIQVAAADRKDQENTLNVNRAAMKAQQDVANGLDPTQTAAGNGVAEGENWSKHNNKRAGGMSKKSVASYRRSHPGSKIQTAVTTKPSKLKKGSKAAKRRASFCARMRGMKKHRTGAKTANDPNSNINKSLRRWHCESIEELHELVMLAEQFIRNKKNEL